jgi:hypothetical protein
VIQTPTCPVSIVKFLTPPFSPAIRSLESDIPHKKDRKL